MIPLGSCTMKLNAAAEMEAVTWPSFADLHPFAPLERSAGTRRIIADLEAWLAELTGYDAVSLQPNSGAQGELAGLNAIRGYHRARGEAHRDVCLIPSSAHGTNAASAVLAGMRVQVVACDDDGNVDVDDLERLVPSTPTCSRALMVTYPSTHGVFEETHLGAVRPGPRPRRSGLPRRREPQRAGRPRQAGPVRGRRQPPQPAQDLLHPPRRRGAGGRAGRLPGPTSRRSCRPIRCSRPAGPDQRGALDPASAPDRSVVRRGARLASSRSAGPTSG
jgi:hypothetical protein